MLKVSFHFVLSCIDVEVKSDILINYVYHHFIKMFVKGTADSALLTFLRENRAQMPHFTFIGVPNHLPQVCFSISNQQVRHLTHFLFCPYMVYMIWRSYIIKIIHINVFINKHRRHMLTLNCHYSLYYALYQHTFTGLVFSSV